LHIKLQFECAKIRRAKETELEIIYAITQNLDNDEEVYKLGNIILSGPATIGPEMKEKYLVRFPNFIMFE